ncbi:peroxidasin homolog [Corticium candelabrum]|uniref:peroxidasin homolog n=1 Tax=Corticium candelabrum TaxID=121492 RepID=UPI002E26CDBC|nr:peroxidasin homolog [Corticium candelabrum]
MCSYKHSWSLKSDNHFGCDNCCSHWRHDKWHSCGVIEISTDVLFPLSIDVGFTPQSILSGRCLKLQCVGSGNPLPVVRWSKNGIQLQHSSDVEISDNGTRLTICSVEASDAGLYMCIVSNEVGQANVLARVDVIVPLRIVSVLDVIDGIVGADVWLPCDATGNPRPRITWYKDNKLINSAALKYHVYTNGTLHVKNLGSVDSGVYKCVATNVGGEHVNVTVDVHFGPTFTTTSLTYNLLVDSDAVFICSVSVNPSPVV